MSRRRRGIGVNATQAQIEQRVAAVYDWILEGAPSHVIVQKVSENYGVGERMAREYITRATEMLREESRSRASTTLEGHLTARWHCYRKACEAEDWKTASMILKDIARLQALYASDRSLLAKAGLDESITQKLMEADSQAADILREVYEGIVI